MVLNNQRVFTVFQSCRIRHLLRRSGLKYALIWAGPVSPFSLMTLGILNCTLDHTLPLFVCPSVCIILQLIEILWTNQGILPWGIVARFSLFLHYTYWSRLLLTSVLLLQTLDMVLMGLADALLRLVAVTMSRKVKLFYLHNFTTPWKQTAIGYDHM